MEPITIRCYAELNTFLPVEKQYTAFMESVHNQRSVKDLVESLGIPHTEIDLVLVDGTSSPFTRKLTGGERVAFYPYFQRLPVDDVTLVRPDSLPGYRFLLDVHLGKLASLLRMMGFDTLYQREATDETLAIDASDDERILLTRDRGLLKRNIVTHGYLIRSEDPETQLMEVLERYRLQDHIHPFTRCMSCNELLVPIPDEQIQSHLPSRVRSSRDYFFQCSGCEKIYWRGSHHEKMTTLIQRIEKKMNEHSEQQ